jgi:hypothetical protein
VKQSGSSDDFSLSRKQAAPARGTTLTEHWRTIRILACRQRRKSGATGRSGPDFRRRAIEFLRLVQAREHEVQL